MMGPAVFRFSPGFGTLLRIDLGRGIWFWQVFHACIARWVFRVFFGIPDALASSRATSWRPRCCRSGPSGASRAARICSRDHRGPLRATGLEGLVIVFSPAGLDEDTLDLFEVDDAGLVADGFDERTQAEIASAAHKSFPGAGDQGKGFQGGGVVAQARAIQLAEDGGFNGFGTQACQHDRVGDAGADCLV